MDIPTAVDLIAARAARILDEAGAPALLPLPHVPVSAETWEDERHIRIHGEALYAVHRGDEAHWMVVVTDSNVLAAGSLCLARVSEIRCETASGRRGG